MWKRLFGESPLEKTIRIQESIILSLRSRIQELEDRSLQVREAERKHEVAIIEVLLHRKPPQPVVAPKMGSFTARSSA